MFRKMHECAAAVLRERKALGLWMQSLTPMCLPPTAGCINGLASGCPGAGMPSPSHRFLQEDNGSDHGS